ncbi:hypothetical protein BY458DRAFT_560485 [Sporodiniella umbellata]|nr:hypothetical protein BY458DRAFT_560485 [Sporodiniella umbellata]
MHPLLIAIIVGGGVLGSFALYEVGSKLYEEYQERRQYEEYIQACQEDSQRREDREFDEKEDKEDPYTRHDQYELRQRRRFSQSSQNEKSQHQDSYEIPERAILDTPKNKSEILVGEPSEESMSSSDHTQRAVNPFMAECEQRSLMTEHEDSLLNESSMLNEQSDPEKSDMDALYSEESNQTTDSLYHSMMENTEASQLQFPSPSLTATQVSTATQSASDSEESWDAISEEEDWVRSLDGSDEERHF